MLDCGSYFGNFSLMLARCGYRVEALDSYARYGRAFTTITALLTSAGVLIRDLDDGLQAVPLHRYHAVLAMGVIEHIPHTPRRFLTALDERLADGGWLFLDTPNLAYVYTRDRLHRGESIFCPLSAQWHTEEPFEGHHREYTITEIEWMLDQIGHTDRRIETFNYSLLVLPRIEGADAERAREMERDPTKREVIFSVSRRPARV